MANIEYETNLKPLSNNFEVRIIKITVTQILKQFYAIQFFRLKTGRW